MSDTYRHKEKGRLKNCPSDNTIVFIEQEYGYRYWVWQTHMSEEQLIEYWQNIEDIGYFSIEDLPGKLIPFDYLSDEKPPTNWRAHYHMNCDSYLKFVDSKNKIYKSYGHKRAGSLD